MRALLRTPLQVQTWSIVTIVTLCFFIGAIIPIFAATMGAKPSRLVALPALLLLIVLLIFDYKKLLVLIILLRSVGDVVLESTEFSFGSFRMGVGGVINLIVIIIACLLILERPQLLPVRLVRYWVPILLMMGVGVATSYEMTDAIKVYLAMLSYFAIFISAVYMVQTNEDFNRILQLVLCSSIIPTAYSLIDIALNMRDSSFRLQSTFTHANILAFYLTLMLVLSLYMLKSSLFNIKPSGRTVICCYIPILLAQLLLTQTRSAWLACFIVFIVYALLFERKYLLYLLFVPLAILFIPSVYDRLMDLGQGNEVIGYTPLNSFAWRVALWESGIRWMEPLRMVYGYGLGGFVHFTQVFFELAGGYNWDAHNVYVQFLFDMGVLGLLCYSWLFARILLTIRAFAGIDRVSGFLMLAIVVQYLIVSFSDNMFRYLVFNWYFWFVVGGACSLVNLPGRTELVSPSSARSKSE